MSNQLQLSPIRTTVLLNMSGDLTLSWSPDEDQKMIEFIKSKMDQGYSFFEVKRTTHFLGLIKTKRQHYLSNTDKLSSREVVMKDVHDAEAEAVLKSGTGAITNTPSHNEQPETTRIIRSPQEAAQTHTVMIKPMMGG